MKPRFHAAACSLVCLVALCCSAQQQPAATPDAQADDLPTLRVTTRTVEIATVVHDKGGAPQEALTRDDFILKVDGREQPIQHFAKAADLPLTLALIVDVSGSQRTFIGDEWRASDVFFQSMLTRPQDRAALLQVDARIRILMNLTNATNRLHLALTQLGSDATSGAATRLNDAVFATAKALLGKEPGRKAIVLLTDGGENASRMSLEQAIEQAQRNNVSIYTVDYSAWTGPDMLQGGFRVNGQGDPGLPLLTKLAQATGGHVYTVSRAMPLEKIYEDIASDLRSAYELGYTPPADLKPNSFHKLEVRTRDKKLLVQARSGFYVQP